MHGRDETTVHSATCLLLPPCSLKHGGPGQGVGAGWGTLITAAGLAGALGGGYASCDCATSPLPACVSVTGPCLRTPM
jgi:hypothetical protein